MSTSLLSQNVSRETLDSLQNYADLIRKWNNSINLVAKSTISDIWDRHILDSAQVYFASLGCEGNTWTDLGSGGGLPGIVVAILANDMDHQRKFHLVESDKRKSVFLRTAIRELGLDNTTIITDRIEGADIPNSDLISARALAPLTNLFSLSQRFSSQSTTFLFQKGKNWLSEIECAQNHWFFEYEVIKSVTDSSAVILKIRGLSRV